MLTLVLCAASFVAGHVLAWPTWLQNAWAAIVAKFSSKVE
jgi:hypothetical protein